MPELPTEKPEVTTGREVIIYNHTESSVSYALNDKFYTLEPKTGLKHFASDNDFFLQFDDDVSDKANIARYYLEGSKYTLYFGKGNAKIEIVRLED